MFGEFNSMIPDLLPVRCEFYDDSSIQFVRNTTVNRWQLCYKTLTISGQWIWDHAIKFARWQHL